MSRSMVHLEYHELPLGCDRLDILSRPHSSGFHRQDKDRTPPCYELLLLFTMYVSYCRMEINVLLYNFIVYTGIWVTYLFFYVNDQSDLYGLHRRSLNLATTYLIELLSTPGFFVKRYILYTNEVFYLNIWSKKMSKFPKKFVI